MYEGHAGIPAFDPGGRSGAQPWGKLRGRKGLIGYANRKWKFQLTLAMNTLCCCWLRMALFVDMAGVDGNRNCTMRRED